MAQREWDLEPMSATLSVAATADDCEADLVPLTNRPGSDEFPPWDDAWIDLGGEA
jgi:hypothetical protein